MTDRIVVKLAPGIDINKIAEEQQIELLASDPFDETQFVLKVPSKNSRNSLSISNDINLIPGVAYAKPDFYSPVRPRQPPMIRCSASSGISRTWARPAVQWMPTSMARAPGTSAAAGTPAW